MKKRSWLDAALVLFIPAAFVMLVVALWWTRGLSKADQSFIWIGFLLAVTAAGTWADVRGEQRKDEIQVAAIRFGTRWSSVPVVLLLATVMLPQVQEPLLGLARTFEGPAHGGPPPPVAMFILGAAAAVLFQLLAASLLRAAWLYSKARP